MIEDDDSPIFEKIRHRPAKEHYTSKQIWAMCGCKKKYTKKSRARAMMDKAMEARGTRLRAYVCPICGLIHVTRKAAVRVGDEPIAKETSSWQIQ